MRILLLADGGLERHGLLRYLQDIAHLIDGHAHLLGYLLGAGVMTQLLQELA